MMSRYFYKQTIQVYTEDVAAVLKYEPKLSLNFQYNFRKKVNWTSVRRLLVLRITVKMGASALLKFLNWSVNVHLEQGVTHVVTSRRKLRLKRGGDFINYIHYIYFTV